MRSKDLADDLAYAVLRFCTVMRDDCGLAQTLPPFIITDTHQHERVIGDGRHGKFVTSALS
jgi:hypothetical protein